MYGHMGILYLESKESRNKLNGIDLLLSEKIKIQTHTEIPNNALIYVQEVKLGCRRWRSCLLQVFMPL